MRRASPTVMAALAPLVVLMLGAAAHAPGRPHAHTHASAPVPTPASGPPPVPGGVIGTLELGKYTCELSGDAGGPIKVPAKEFDFTVIRGSSYRSEQSRGSYLLTGDIVTMTSGRLKGMKLHRISTGFLRRVLADGTDGDMRCVSGTAGN